MRYGSKTNYWNLDTGNDGCDETGLEGSEEEVMADVMHHHDLEEWPAHWELTRLHLDRQNKSQPEGN